MNKQLQEFARTTIKEGLTQLPESHTLLFKKMYSHKNLDASLNDVVSVIPEDKLDWAMQQVQNSLDKLVTKFASECICAKPDNDAAPYGDHCLACGGTIYP